MLCGMHRNLKLNLRNGLKMLAMAVRFLSPEKDQSFLLPIQRVLGGKPLITLVANSMMWLCNNMSSYIINTDFHAAI